MFITKNILTRVMISLTLAFAYMNCSYSQRSQAGDPVIGYPIEDHTFNDIVNFSRTKIKLSDFRGKYLILDFWNHTCTACMFSFPEIDQINKTYGSNVQVLSVGYTGVLVPGEKPVREEIKALFKRITKTNKFSFPVAFDSTLSNRYNIGEVGYPYIIVIDPKGIVRSITNRIKVENIDQILAHNYSGLKPITRMSQRASMWYISKVDSLTQYLSSFSKSDGSYSQILTGGDWKRLNLRSDFKIVGARLDYFFRLAYFEYPDWDDVMDTNYSKIRYYPLLEIPDSAMFDFDNKYTFEIKNMQSLSKPQICAELRKTLEAVYHFSASIEERDCPYWSVSINDSLKKNLITSGAKQDYRPIEGGFGGFEVVNVPMSTIISYLNWSISLHSVGGVNGVKKGAGMPFIDETGLSSNIDLRIAAFIKNFGQFRSALTEKGFNIQIRIKKMKCLVIREIKN